MNAHQRRPGVLLSVRWGTSQLAREFLPLDTKATFSVGTEPGCSFAAGGAKRFPLVELDGEGFALRSPGKAKWSRTELERKQQAELSWGALTFEATLLDAPPAAGRSGETDFTMVNLTLAMIAAFGFFAIAAANRDAQGAELDDGLEAARTRMIKSVLHQPERAASAAASAAAPQKKELSKPLNSPNNHARTMPPSRPAGKPNAPVVDVSSIFKGPGAAQVFSQVGLGGALALASTGLRTAEAGNGLGVLGGGHGLDGRGLGGLGLEGIGVLGTHGRGGGNDKYGTGHELAGKTSTPIVPIESDLESCTSAGSGCLDKELIRRVIHQNLAGFRYCYESALTRSQKLEGKVSMRFAILQSGRVSTADVASSTVGNSELEHCVAVKTRMLQFPASKFTGLVVITYPFVFKQSGQ